MTSPTTTTTVKVTIDDVVYEVPAGTNLVDAAKWIGNDVPVFCYHPKMKPVGMCRMCLVEMGSIEKDRATGQVVLDEQGNPKVRWMPKLQTACTNNVSDGMVIRTGTKIVEDARRNVVEFLLTSHPLDCPVCDKGGECPLQNLTMAHGPGASRMNFEDKMNLDKHVPLGDLIFLDEERCIQCARCVRFQEEVVGDAVLGFHERGRSLQIVTTSEPGFDTYFSGNTTDICPVGALTTADFRFGARPWELTNVPTVCPHCPVGCNTTASTRLDRDFGGRAMIKRMMPRQNEEVNEIWMCDKGRFGHHFTRSDMRLTQPMIRDSAGKLVASNWQEALRVAAVTISTAGGSVAAIAGAGLSNEDLWELRRLVHNAGGSQLGAWPPTHAGADLIAQVGVGKGTNLGKLGKGDVVLVIASDLEEEAPIWRLRIKQAAERGAKLVVANARPTRMDDFATHTYRYATGDAASFLHTVREAQPALAEALSTAANLIIVAGAEGLTLDGSRALMQAAANILIETGHVGKPQNGLMATLPGANGMGLYYMGFSPEQTYEIAAQPPKVLIIAGADVLADDPAAATWLAGVEAVISLTMFPDEAAHRAISLMPIQSFAERDGTFTNGERRVQRFYTAQGPMGDAIPTWQAIARLSEKLEYGKPKLSAAQVMNDIVANVPAFAGMRYNELGKTPKQFPDVGGADQYYGGTSYKNTGGIGVQAATTADTGEVMTAGAVTLPQAVTGDIVVVPTTRLYNRERTFLPSVAELMGPRTDSAFVEVNAADAAVLHIADGELVTVTVDGSAVTARAHVNGAAPQGTVLVPRHLSETAAPLTVAVGTIRKA